MTVGYHMWGEPIPSSEALLARITVSWSYSKCNVVVATFHHPSGSSVGGSRRAGHIYLLRLIC